MRIRTIIQEESSGCGIACAAMLTGKSYAEIKGIANGLGIFAEDEKLWSETGYVRRLLAEHGIKASNSEAKFESWEALPSLALLALKYRIEDGRPFWHWTVFQRFESRPLVLDPAAYLTTNEREDFDKMSPEWFIEIAEA